MSTGNRGRSGVSRPGRCTKLLGSFTLHGGDSGTRLTISDRLDNEEFPNQVGSEVDVELVYPGDQGMDDKPYLKIYPSDQE